MNVLRQAINGSIQMQADFVDLAHLAALVEDEDTHPYLNGLKTNWYGHIVQITSLKYGAIGLPVTLVCTHCGKLPSLYAVAGDDGTFLDVFTYEEEYVCDLRSADERGRLMCLPCTAGFLCPLHSASEASSAEQEVVHA